MTTGVLELVERGRAAFNRGAYFEAHELWEEAWRDLAGTERLFLQGLIQIAAGLHHLQEGRPGPAASLLRKGLDKITSCAPALVAHLSHQALAHAVARVRTELDAGATAPDVSGLEL